MIILKNFKRTITIVLCLAIFIFALVAIILSFTKELFIAANQESNVYEIRKTLFLTYYKPYTNVVGTPSYTMQGIIKFANDMKEHANVSTTITQKFVIADYVPYAMNMKTLVIFIFIFEGIFVVGQIFSSRVFTNVLSSLGIFVLLNQLKSVGIGHFYNVGLIVDSTKDFNTIKAFWLVAFIISVVYLIFVILVHEKKKNKGE